LAEPHQQTILAGKTAIVTGGTHGIGWAAVRRLLEAGVQVSLCACGAASVTAAQSRLPTGSAARGGVAAVTSVEQVKRICRRHGSALGAVGHSGEQRRDRHFPAGGRDGGGRLAAGHPHKPLRAFPFCRAALPHFRSGGGGQIANISSLTGRNPFAGGAAYNASRFGLNGFTEELMLAHRYESIRVSFGDLSMRNLAA
jgi:NAD(P)-dependent dehydrogenase (short-subunit alcohol dehydrogenase family)